MLEADIRASHVGYDANAGEVYANLAPNTLSPAQLCAIVGRSIAIVNPRGAFGLVTAGSRIASRRKDRIKSRPKWFVSQLAVE